MPMYDAPEGVAIRLEHLRTVHKTFDGKTVHGDVVQRTDVTEIGPCTDTVVALQVHHFCV